MILLIDLSNYPNGIEHIFSKEFDFRLHLIENCIYLNEISIQNDNDDYAFYDEEDEKEKIDDIYDFRYNKRDEN
jgi:hypothetical protein